MKKGLSLSGAGKEMTYQQNPSEIKQNLKNLRQFERRMTIKPLSNYANLDGDGADKDIKLSNQLKKFGGKMY